MVDARHAFGFDNGIQPLVCLVKVVGDFERLGHGGGISGQCSGSRYHLCHEPFALFAVQVFGYGLLHYFFAGFACNFGFADELGFEFAG